MTAELPKLFRKCRAARCDYRNPGLRILTSWLTQ
jgi:hypothetical protein